MDTSGLLKTFVSIPSPSGYENEAKTCFIKLVTPYVDDCFEDVHGNVIAKRNGKTEKTIMLIAHIDRIGMVITYIEDNGFLRFNTIGNCDSSILKGRKVIISHRGNRLTGIIGSVPVHLRKQNLNNRNGEIDISELWIDIGVSSKEKAEQLVSIGDCIAFESSLTSLNSDNVTASGLDNAVGIVILLEVISQLSEETDYNICLVASIQEEIGLRGAITASYTVQPNICIAIDVTHATDYPSMNKSRYGDICLGKGCVIPFGADMTPYIQDNLRLIGKENTILYQTEVCNARSCTDIHSVQIVRGGCATGLISIPCRYMHTPVEVVSLKDIENASKILYNFIRLTTGEADSIC